MTPVTTGSLHSPYFSSRATTSRPTYLYNRGSPYWAHIPACRQAGPRFAPCGHKCILHRRAKCLATPTHDFTSSQNHSVSHVRSQVEFGRRQTRSRTRLAVPQACGTSLRFAQWSQIFRLPPQSKFRDPGSRFALLGSQRCASHKIRKPAAGHVRLCGHAYFSAEKLRDPASQPSCSGSHIAENPPPADLSVYVRALGVEPRTSRVSVGRSTS